MNAVGTITVYNFRVFEYDAGEFCMSPFKAPRGLILEQFGGEVLEGTAEDVEVSLLDRDGRYRRIATGWGELS